MSGEIVREEKEKRNRYQTGGEVDPFCNLQEQAHNNVEERKKKEKKRNTPLNPQQEFTHNCSFVERGMWRDSVESHDADDDSHCQPSAV